MQNKVDTNSTIYYENFLPNSINIKKPANENFKRLEINALAVKQQTYALHLRTLLLSKRLKYILIKLKLQPDELVHILENNFNR